MTVGSRPARRGEARRRLLEDRFRQTTTDLEELEGQVQAGEISAEKAGELRKVYLAERRRVEDELQRLPARAAESIPTRERPARSDRIWWLIVAASVIALVAFVGQSVLSDGGGSDDPGSADPATARMEELVAAHPEDNTLRLNLADQLLQQREYGRALDHYIAVTAHDPEPDEEANALGRIGWVAHLSGDAEIAADYLTASLEIDPDNAQSKLFLGLVYLYGFDDAVLALPLLEEAETVSELPSDVAEMVQEALAEARLAVAEGGS